MMSAMASQITCVSIVYSTVCWGTHQRKHLSIASLAFVRGIHHWSVDYPHKGASNAEYVSIWWHHHVGTTHKSMIYCSWQVQNSIRRCLLWVPTIFQSRDLIGDVWWYFRKKKTSQWPMDRWRSYIKFACLSQLSIAQNGTTCRHYKGYMN